MNKSTDETVLTYKDLAPFTDEANILAVMRDIVNTINEQDDFTSIFHAITNLRQFNRYNSLLFAEVFNNIFYKFIDVFGSCTDSGVALNSIYLVKEIFSTQEDYIQDWIKQLIQIVLLKALSEDDQLVKEQAILALHNLTDKMHFAETIEILLEYINLDDFSDLSFQLLYALIKKFDQGLLENLENWDGIFLEIMEMYTSKDKKYIDFGREIFVCIYEKIGRERFEEFLKNAGVSEDTLCFIELIIGDIYPDEVSNFGQKLVSLNSNSKLKSGKIRIHF
jgi:hypothetical protein